MPNARQKILNYIIEQQTATVEELSKVFRVTPANIRHHLSILCQQGSVRVIGQKVPPAKGRPAQIYCSSQQSDIDNLDHLSDALLSTLAVNTSPDVLAQLLQDVAKSMSSGYKSDLANPTRRLYSAIHALNRMNYQAHWEAHIENPRIMLGRCPYWKIIDSHPELCSMDAALLENMLKSHVRQVQKQIPNLKGLPQCVFLVQKTSP